MGNIFSFGALLKGGAVVFPRNNGFKNYMTDINLFAATHIIIPPVIAMKFIPYLHEEGWAFPSIKHFRLVGSSLSEGLIKTTLNKMSPHLYFPYGISEVGAISLATPEMIAKNPATSGQLKKWVKAEAINDQGQVLPRGQTGRIRVSIENMPQGYYKNDDASKNQFKDGWFYTNDLGYINENDEVFIEGRADDMINLDGDKFNPVKFESMLAHKYNIKDVVLFASKDSRDSSKVFGVFVADEASVEEGLSAHPNIKRMVGKRRIYAKELPRNENGKLLRKDLTIFFSKEINQLKDL
jgi:acyl-coenzyme A synthetase/AMP-(fatty) acid ligase